MTEEIAKDIRCPFCGAPYKKLVPTNTLQLKCDYCGAIFHTPPKLGVEIPRCYNHCERYATGICNDCGQNFCSACLTAFSLVTEHARALLYLCPNCLRRRNLEKIDANILGAAFFLIVGILSLVFGLALGSPFWLFGMFLTFASGAAVLYSEDKRSKLSSEVVPETSETLSVGGIEGNEKGPATSAAEAEETDRLYDGLFTRYVEHWGIQTGAQLLDDEIQAYTRHGDSYGKAMRKIAERNKIKGR